MAGTFSIGPIVGLDLAGTEGTYRFERITTSPHQVITINEGTVDLSRSRTVTATCPPAGHGLGPELGRQVNVLLDREVPAIARGTVIEIVG